MKKIIFYLLFTCLAYTGYAQESWKTLNEQGEKLYEQAKYPEAITAFEKAKVQAEKEFGKLDSNYATSCNSLALLYFKQGLYAKSEPLYIEAKNIREKVFGKEHPNYAFSCNNLALLYKEQGLYEKAEPLYLEAKGIFTKVFGKDHPDYAACCDNLASLYNEQGLYAKAEPLYLEAKEIRLRVSGKNHVDYSISCINLANMYKNQGFYEKADSLYVYAKKIFLKTLGREHPDYATVCNNLAGLYDEQGLYKKAEPLYLEAKEITLKVLGKEHPDYAISCSNLATLYKEQALYKKAEPLFVEAKEINLKILGKNHPEYASSCNNLAVLYDSQGLYEKAEPLYLESKEIFTKVVGKEHPDYAMACNNLAYLYYMQGLDSIAETLYIEAKEIILKIFGRNHPDYARYCGNLASLYADLGLYDKAETLHLEAKEIRLKVLGKDHLDNASSCNSLASLYYKQKLYEKAEPLYVEAKEIRLKVLGKDHPDYAGSCHNLAELYYIQGLFEKAEPLYLESKKIVLKHIQNNFANLTEQEKETYWLDNLFYFEYYHFFISTVLEEPDYPINDLVNSQLQTKAIILGETQKMKKRILASKDSALINQFETWQAVKNNIAKAYNLSIAEREKRGIDITNLENEANEIEKQLAAKSADFAKAFTPKNYTYKDLQKQLKEDEVAIEVIKVDLEYAYLVVFITKKDLQIVALRNGEELETKLFKIYRNNIRYQNDDKTSYNNFWKPFLPYLKKAKKVYFCPDGVYNQLSLNTLQNPETNKFLGEETDITIVGNLKDIFQENSNNTNKTAELFGRPDYKKGNKKDEKQEENKDRSLENDRNFASFSSIKKASFADLKGTEIEVKGIASNLSQQNYKVGLFLGADAIEEQVKATNSPKILHISTHGYFVPSDSKNKINGMLSSGIVLAGVNDTTEIIGREDGVLTAYEASTLNLDNTDLVVLSACETGLGEVATGEGVYGLQRGFKVAGADAVLMSLWKVDDKATQELMNSFYANWLKTDNKRQALLAAQAELRKKYKFPYYWGAFVLIGE